MKMCPRFRKGRAELLLGEISAAAASFTEAARISCLTLNEQFFFWSRADMGQDPAYIYLLLILLASYPLEMNEARPSECLH